VSAPRPGRSFSVTPSGDRTLDRIQQDLKGTLDQLEEARRGLLVGPAISAAGDLDMGEQLVARYVGPGGHTFRLPLVAGRGQARAQVLVVIHAGQGALTVMASGKDTLRGGTLALTVGQMAVLVSDGLDAWNRIYA
jgi:hypothetical protein